MGLWWGISSLPAPVRKRPIDKDKDKEASQAVLDKPPGSWQAHLVGDEGSALLLQQAMELVQLAAVIVADPNMGAQLKVQRLLQSIRQGCLWEAGEGKVHLHPAGHLLFACRTRILRTPLRMAEEAQIARASEGRRRVQGCRLPQHPEHPGRLEAAASTPHSG